MYIVRRIQLDLEERKTAMQAAVGLWKDRKDMVDSAAYVRGLRRGTRLQYLHGA